MPDGHWQLGPSPAHVDGITPILGAFQPDINNLDHVCKRDAKDTQEMPTSHLFAGVGISAGFSRNLRGVVFSHKG